MGNDATKPTGDSAQIRDPHKGVDGGPIVCPPDGYRLGVADKLPYPPAVHTKTDKAGKDI